MSPPQKSVLGGNLPEIFVATNRWRLKLGLMDCQFSLVVGFWELVCILASLLAHVINHSMSATLHSTIQGMSSLPITYQPSWLRITWYPTVRINQLASCSFIHNIYSLMLEYIGNDPQESSARTAFSFCVSVSIVEERSRDPWTDPNEFNEKVNLKDSFSDFMPRENMPDSWIIAYSFYGSVLARIWYWLIDWVLFCFVFLVCRIWRTKSWRPISGWSRYCFIQMLEKMDYID